MKKFTLAFVYGYVATVVNESQHRITRNRLATAGKSITVHVHVIDYEGLLYINVRLQSVLFLLVLILG